MAITQREQKKKLLKLKELEEQEEKLKLEIASQFRLNTFLPYVYQKAVIDHFRAGANIICLPVSNRVGKSRLGSALVHSWAKGYEPWNPVPDTYEGAVRAEDDFFMPSSLGRRPPVDIRITGEDWEEHLKKTVVPELKFFAGQPLDREWETSKNNTSVEASWTHKPTGSTFNLMTYKQDFGSFESFKGHAWWADEPPPKEVWSAMSRALFMTGGKVFMSMTPLKEAWIWDEIINSNRPDVKTITGITLWDCPHLYNNDISVLMKCGFLKEEAVSWFAMQKYEARVTKELPESGRVLKEKLGKSLVNFRDEFGRPIEQDAYTYAIQNLQIHRFIKDLQDDNERIPRVFGEPKYLMGRVLKSFDHDKHVVDDFKVPPDWPVEFQIDFHLNEPHLITFTACDPFNRYFVVKELWANIGSEQLADEIVRFKSAYQWRLKYGEIDALSKGDQAYVKNRLGRVEDSFSVIQRKLQKYGIRLGVGSKDEKSYVTATETRLKGPNGMPTLFICRSCVETVKQVERWVYGDNQKPGSDGHAGECIGRQTQTGLKYSDPRQFDKPLKYAECPA